MKVVLSFKHAKKINKSKLIKKSYLVGFSVYRVIKDCFWIGNEFIEIPIIVFGCCKNKLKIIF
jgi:hypothetical protein